MPGVVKDTAYGAPAPKLGGKLVACIPTNKSAEANSLVVHIDLEHRACDEASEAGQPRIGCAQKALNRPVRRRMTL
jgi:hypothetical protein